ncbi:hypothetical protein TNCV_871391 [Trichonephila clavipes]|nr:hypothetical protein TNCV_871391 [Trichonephila clavipes]
MRDRTHRRLRSKTSQSLPFLYPADTERPFYKLQHFTTTPQTLTGSLPVFQIHLDPLRPTVTYRGSHLEDPNVVLTQPFTGVKVTSNLNMPAT